MRVDRGLGVAGGARRVAHPGGVGLLERRPRRHRRGGGQQRFVVERARRDLGAGRVLHHDDVLDGFELLADRLERRPAGGIDDEHPVGRVVDDVGDVLSGEPDVHRVQHGAHERRREVGLEMAVRVPGERPHAVTLADTERLERAGQPPGALGEIGVGGSHEADAGNTRGQRLLREEAARALEDVLDGERVMHHQIVDARHQYPPRSSDVAHRNETS